MRRFIYGVGLVAGITGLTLSIHPVLNMLTPFDMVKNEMRESLATSCTSACCATEAENMTFGFGYYAKEENVACWKGFKNVNLECLKGTYCVYGAWYAKERSYFDAGHNVEAPLFHQRDVEAENS